MFDSIIYYNKKMERIYMDNLNELVNDSIFIKIKIMMSLW